MIGLRSPPRLRYDGRWGAGFEYDPGVAALKQTLEYCRKAFRFALLEHRSGLTPDRTILDREGFWKDILLARGEYGPSRN
jgi:hypothetical protein